MENKETLPQISKIEEIFNKIKSYLPMSKTDEDILDINKALLAIGEVQVTPYKSGLFRVDSIAAAL